MNKRNEINKTMIKKLFTAGMLLIAIIASTTITANAQFQYPSFKWNITEYDFGTIQHLDPVVYEFEFMNINSIG